MGLVRNKPALIAVKLFNGNLTTPVLVDDLTEKISDLKFSTVLHGGFGVCSFELACDLPAAWQWRTGYLFYRLIVEDSEHTLFEGRLEDIEFIPSGIRVTFFGYYSSCGDQPYSTAYNSTADVIIKAILTAACPDISSDQSNIDAPDTTVAGIAENEDLYLADSISKLSSYSDSSQQTWYFAIWEGRVPYFFARSITAIDWLISLADVESLGLRVSAKELWNKCYAEYTSGGTRTRTATSTNQASIDKYGVTRLKAVVNLGEVAAAAAQAQRDWFLEGHRELAQEVREFTLGSGVRDANNVVKPSSWIRAGDVIRIQDLVPASADVDSVTLDALRTFYIKETRYDVDTQRMTIVPDSPTTRLEAVIARDYQRHRER